MSVQVNRRRFFVCNEDIWFVRDGEGSEKKEQENEK